MNTPKNWNRVGYVKIIPENGNEWTSLAPNGMSLDFSFDIKKPLAAVCMEAHISIFGMNWDNICAFSTWTAEAIALGLNNQIEVYAGYGTKPEDATCIFRGTIYNAMPTQPPDRVLNIKARSGFYRFCKPVNGDNAEKSGEPKEEPKLNVHDWFNKTASIIGGVVNTENYVSTDKDKEEISQAAFGVNATHDSVFKRMCKQAEDLVPEAILIENDPKYNPETKKQEYSFTLLNRLADDDPSPDKAITVSMETGMVGLPTVSFQDIEFTTLMNHAIVRGGYIKLVSQFTPNLNKMKFRKEGGKIEESESFEIYRVYEVRYHGQLRGEKWYTTFRAWRFWKTGMVDYTEIAQKGSL